METYSGKNEGMEMSISIKDMLMRVCLKWRAMIVWAIVFAILFNGIGILKDYKAVQAQKKLEAEDNNRDIQLEMAKKELAKTKKELNDREILDVQRALNSYDELQEKYELNNEYYENAIKMKVNALAAPTLTINYDIDTKYQIEYPVIDKKDYTSAIISAYCDEIQSEKTVDMILDNMSSKIERGYISELISLSSQNSRLCIKIIATTKEECVAMGEVVKDVVSNATTTVKNRYGDFDINLVKDSYDVIADNDLLDDQTSVVHNINSIRSSIGNITSLMNENQKNYYAAVLDYESNVNPAKEADAVENINVEEPSAYVVKTVHLKMLILGIVFGIFIVSCMTGIIYVFASRMRAEDDMEEIYGIHHLGTLSVKPRKNIIDKLIWEAFYGKNDFTYEEKLRMIDAGIKVYAKKMNMQKIFITGSCRERLEKYYEEVAEKLKEDALDVQYGVSIIWDPESLEKLAESDGVVLVEKVGSSFYKEIKKEIEICTSTKIQIIGTVILN